MYKFVQNTTLLIILSSMNNKKQSKGVLQFFASPFTPPGMNNILLFCSGTISGTISGRDCLGLFCYLINNNSYSF